MCLKFQLARTSTLLIVAIAMCKASEVNFAVTIFSFRYFSARSLSAFPAVTKSAFSEIILSARSRTFFGADSSSARVTSEIIAVYTPLKICSISLRDQI